LLKELHLSCLCYIFLLKKLNFKQTLKIDIIAAIIPTAFLKRMPYNNKREG